MSALDPDVGRRLLEEWDVQQSAYVAHREQRFGVLLEVVRLHLGDEVTVLDLACGPGAISERVLTALPGASTIAVDYDPILLTVARAALAVHGDRARVLDVDLAAPGWTRALGVEKVDAVLSSTALHWLSPAQLLATYEAAATLLRPGGLLLNADHLRFDAAFPTLRTLAEQHDAQTQRAGFAAGALEYDAWYAEAAREPALAALGPERQRRFADRPPQALAPLDFHLAALRAAGFAEVGTVWQYFDDYVVLARR
ncbi:class I SAM-dependent methyltransferase [Cryptosporangium minutisporangium]|uniref:Class I SAM-dependent methyltransferase n=1 Tax=Cryptosporangium minutisporangium TaxID=113569 RepID=A0ABP6T143_9ACTN